LGIFTMSFDLGVSVGTLIGGVSHYIGFTAMYLSLAVLPLLGLLLFWYTTAPSGSQR